ncbi:MAG: hypothetical protein HY820_14705 [Acidobacteria bacterium]|nr:hypothetical protein [Acidobacteriota bacterium]
MRPAELVAWPLTSDSNSPAFWIGTNFHLMQSIGEPYLSVGDSQFNLHSSSLISVRSRELETSPVWIESVWVDDDYTVFGWYHTERLVCGDQLSWPRIGAAVSYDGGESFQDLGIVLEAPGQPDCSAANGYFAGGNGDFTVLRDSAGEYFYFYFSAYSGDTTSQGIAVARMAFADRFWPAGQVWKFQHNSFSQPGLGGDVTPVFPAATSWSSDAPDALWGPSLHWNSYLGQYVMLMSRSCCSIGWPTEGTYISFNSNLGNPSGWTAPRKILDAPYAGWYPQVLGLEPGSTDRSAGQVARFYTGGTSEWEIVFSGGNAAEASSPRETGLPSYKTPLNAQPVGSRK